MITNKVTREENHDLMVAPTEKEIEDMVFSLPEAKSPGIDRVMAEVLRRGWTLMKDACIEMLQAFWKDGILTSKASGPVPLLSMEKKCHNLIGLEFLIFKFIRVLKKLKLLLVMWVHYK